MLVLGEKEAQTFFYFFIFYIIDLLANNFMPK